MSTAGDVGRVSGTAEPLTPRRADASLGELFSEMTAEVSQLFHQELELAKVEMKEEGRRAGKGIGIMSGAAVAGHLALLLMSFAAAWGLAEVMPTAVGFVIVGVLYAVIAAALFVRGRRELKEVHPLPQQTVETLKEDAAWARAQKS
ncbi:MAG TPA: phage holin family protein [Acidimicrobiales bacterium]|nr:phage holin family protein [Acidimicrobiales bacterium]